MIVLLPDPNEDVALRLLPKGPLWVPLALGSRLSSNSARRAFRVFLVIL